ncbi:MAG TPA: hypothetical protein VHT73_12865 [Thermodesulfobacteriota bacterium]|nr:hypothetical protein [Thermodesulfobacteriota bacterium]
MNITIAPFTVDPTCHCKMQPVGKGENHINKCHTPITYWGIYLNDKHISRTSSKELAEQIKLWLEKWLRNREGKNERD